jgi:hypothetical protein
VLSLFYFSGLYTTVWRINVNFLSETEGIYPTYILNNNHSNKKNLGLNSIYPSVSIGSNSSCKSPNVRTKLNPSTTSSSMNFSLFPLHSYHDKHLQVTLGRHLRKIYHETFWREFLQGNLAPPSVSRFWIYVWIYELIQIWKFGEGV